MEERRFQIFSGQVKKKYDSDSSYRIDIKKGYVGYNLSFVQMKIYEYLKG
jgi:hypothetical protein